ncbi:MAG: hypothetical protein AB7I68_10805 [Porticoccaceae bacterium]
MSPLWFVLAGLPHWPGSGLRPRVPQSRGVPARLWRVPDPGFMWRDAHPERGAAGANLMPRQPAPGVAADRVHPNEFDCRRIVRLLESRRRYRYVEPRVVPIPNGYRIESPCCSRNVDPAGGVIDIALIEHCSDQDPWVQNPWVLYRKVHPEDTWIIDSRHPSLTAVLALLNQDVDRLFWP